MGDINNLIIFNEARELVRQTGQLASGIAFGDLANQIRRAPLSVACNICEGAGSGSDPQFVRYLGIARGSINELHGQLLIATDLGHLDQNAPIIALANRLGRRLTCFIRRLRDG